MKDVIVIGSGPAGFASALYTARAGRSTAVLTGPQLGGQVSMTWEIDNYPGFPDDLTGAELTDNFMRHVEKFGAELIYDDVTEVDFSGPPHKVTTFGGEHEARVVVVAVGASPNKLLVPGEDDMVGRGVSYCATCDGAFFRGQDVLVVGGGDSAIEEALFLTRFADSVRVVHRRDELRAGASLQRRAMANDKIDFEWNTVIEEIAGDGKVEYVKTRRTDTGEEGRLDASGVFIFIGHYPNSKIVEGQVDTDDHGYVIVDDRMRASVEGVYAAGEIMDPVWRQVSTSVGQGAAAGMAIDRYLSSLED
ncbi:MAG: thioredoxin-disulfide reductase [Anaerolineae bacterium]